MSDNHAKFPPLPLLGVNLTALYDDWQNDPRSELVGGDALDQSMPPIDLDTGGFPGTTPPQTGSHFEDGLEAPSFNFDEMRGASSATNYGEHLSASSADPFRLSSRGERKQKASGDARSDESAFSQYDTLANTSQNVVTGSARRSAFARSVRKNQNTKHPSMAADSKASPPSNDKAPIRSPRTEFATAAASKPDAGNVDRPRKAPPKQNPPPGRDLMWLEKFRLLERYKEVHGDCDVPQKLPLGTWVNKQRMEKKKVDKTKALHSNAQFMLRYRDKAHVDHKDAVSEMHELKTPMNQERCDRLESIGFKWAKPKGQTAWNERFQELEAYKEENGDCVVPTKYKENTALGRWVTSQRYDKKNGTIKEENKKRLDNIGFVWDRYDKKESRDEME